MMRWKKKLDIIVPLVIAVAIFVLFSVLTDGNFISRYNIFSMLDTMYPIVIGGLGLIFVISQGSIDISQGQILLLAGTVAAMMGGRCNIFITIVTVLFIGAVIGLVNGFIVAKFKVPSMMVTVAVQIMLKGFVVGALNNGTIFASASILALNANRVKIPLVIGTILIMGYLFTYSRWGYYSRTISENEVVVKYSGVQIDRVKIFAFMASGVMAALASIVTLANVGGASVQLGSAFSINVLIALFIGGTPVEGGMGTKVYKMLLGTVTVSMLQNGLTLMGIKSDIYQAIEGIVLLLMVLLSMYLNAQMAKEKKLRVVEKEKAA